MDGRVRWGFLAALAMLCAVTGCGMSGESSTRHARTAAAETGKGFPGKYLSNGECTRARVFVGKALSAVDFEAWCHGGRQERHVGFVVSRLMRPYRGRHTGITGFQHLLMVSGVGGGSGRGVCQRAQGDLACNAVAKGAVLLSGRLFLNPKTRCKWGMEIWFVVPPARMAGEMFAGSLVTKALVTGLPQGC